MLKKDFQTFLAVTFDNEIFKTSKEGQKEYALSEDAFDNFNRLSVELGISREQVLLVYFSKHRDGIISYIKGHKSQREPVQGRIKDCIVYLFLLWAMINESEKLDSPTHGAFNNDISATPKDVIIEKHIERTPSDKGDGLG